MNDMRDGFDPDRSQVDSFLAHSQKTYEFPPLLSINPISNNPNVNPFGRKGTKLGDSMGNTSLKFGLG